MLSHRTGRARAELLRAGVLIAAQMLGTSLVQAQESAPPKKGVVVTAPLALSVKTDQRTYHADSAIKFTLTAKNTTPQDMPVRFNSGQRYDFELFHGKDAKGDKVWQWARGRMFTMMLSSTTLKPGKTLPFIETYRPGSDAMPRLTPGVYTVVATLKGVAKGSPPAALPSASTTFQVK